MTTHKEKVLNYLREHGSITYRECEVLLHINSPRDIIYQLKKTVNLECVRRSVKGLDSEGRVIERTYYNEYFLVDE